MSIRNPKLAVTGRDAPASLHAALGGVAAALAAGAGMAFLRSTLQVRTIPERVLEWLLLLVPLDVFEAALQRFGFDAKRYALYASIVGMLLLLAVLGARALRRRWSTRAILALGLGLWLFTMIVIMPITSAGFFAIELIDGTKAAIGGYFAVALTYAATLALVRGLVTETARAPAGRLSARRSAIVLVGGALASFGATFLANRVIPKSGPATTVVVLDPQEPVPSGGIDPPNPHPIVVSTHEPTGPATVGPVAAGPSPEPSPPPIEPPPAAAQAPNSTAFPEPAPVRSLTRDKDGAVLPSGRRPGELAQLITDNQDFYVVTKNAAGDPVGAAKDWVLRVDGEVQRPFQLGYASLRNLPAVEVTKTLECISNLVAECHLAPFGCDLMSTARWKGVRLRDVLDLAGGLKPGVVSLATISADEFTTALPIDLALDPDTLLIYEMNGQVLPREHGYPVRMLVPGLYGMKNAKWVVSVRPVGREFVDWYGQRKWSKQGVVKTMARIDEPAPGAELPPGEHRVAGVAYAGDRGVAKVELSSNGGKEWRIAELIEPPLGPDTWVRWQARFTLAPATDLTLVARATDGTGALQIEEFSLPEPDGGSGWPAIEVRARR